MCTAACEGESLSKVNDERKKYLHKNRPWKLQSFLYYSEALWQILNQILGTFVGHHWDLSVYVKKKKIKSRLDKTNVLFRDN